MKKILFISFFLLFVGSVSSVMAATSISMSFASGKTGLSLYGDDTTASSTTELIGKSSTGVGVGCFLNGTEGDGYALLTQHKNGSKVYGTSYDSTSIYSEDATVGTVKLAVPTATDTTDFVSWKEL